MQIHISSIETLLPESREGQAQIQKFPAKAVILVQFLLSLMKLVHRDKVLWAFCPTSRASYIVRLLCLLPAWLPPCQAGAMLRANRKKKKYRRLGEILISDKQQKHFQNTYVSNCLGQCNCSREIFFIVHLKYKCLWASRIFVCNIWQSWPQHTQWNCLRIIEKPRQLVALFTLSARQNLTQRHHLQSDCQSVNLCFFTYYYLTVHKLRKLSVPQFIYL